MKATRLIELLAAAVRDHGDHHVAGMVDRDSTDDRTYQVTYSPVEKMMYLARERVDWHDRELLDAVVSAMRSMSDDDAEDLFWYNAVHGPSLSRPLDTLSAGRLRELAGDTEPADPPTAPRPGYPQWPFTAPVGMVRVLFDGSVPDWVFERLEAWGFHGVSEVRAVNQVDGSVCIFAVFDRRPGAPPESYTLVRRYGPHERVADEFTGCRHEGCVYIKRTGRLFQYWGPCEHDWFSGSPDAASAAAAAVRVEGMSPGLKPALWDPETGTFKAI